MSSNALSSKLSNESMVVCYEDLIANRQVNNSGLMIGFDDIYEQHCSKPIQSYTVREERRRLADRCEAKLPVYCARNFSSGYYSVRELSLAAYEQHCLETEIPRDEDGEILYYSVRCALQRRDFYGPWSVVLMRKLQNKYGFSLENLHWLQKNLMLHGVSLTRPVRFEELSSLTSTVETVILDDLVGCVLQPTWDQWSPRFENIEWPTCNQNIAEQVFCPKFELFDYTEFIGADCSDRKDTNDADNQMSERHRLTDFNNIVEVHKKNEFLEKTASNIVLDIGNNGYNSDINEDSLKTLTINTEHLSPGKAYSIADELLRFEDDKVTSTTFCSQTKQQNQPQLENSDKGLETVDLQHLAFEYGKDLPTTSANNEAPLDAIVEQIVAIVSCTSVKNPVVGLLKEFGDNLANLLKQLSRKQPATLRQLVVILQDKTLSFIFDKHFNVLREKLRNFAKSMTHDMRSSSSTNKPTCVDDDSSNEDNGTFGVISASAAVADINSKLKQLKAIQLQRDLQSARDAVDAYDPYDLLEDEHLKVNLDYKLKEFDSGDLYISTNNDKFLNSPQKPSQSNSPKNTSLYSAEAKRRMSPLSIGDQKRLKRDDEVLLKHSSNLDENKVKLDDVIELLESCSENTRSKVSHDSSTVDGDDDNDFKSSFRASQKSIEALRRAEDRRLEILKRQEQTNSEGTANQGHQSNVDDAQARSKMMQFASMMGSMLTMNMFMKNVERLKNLTPPAAPVNNFSVPPPMIQIPPHFVPPNVIASSFPPPFSPPTMMNFPRPPL